MTQVLSPTAPDVADQYIELRGLRFHYRESGSPAHPPAVVLHGLMGHTREWDMLVERLAGSHHVFALDQRGHGESAWADDYTIDAMTADVAAFLEAMQLESVTLVGHSMGAMIGSVLAAERPDLVQKLVVIDVGPQSLGSPWARDELPAFLESLAESVYEDPEEAVREWLAGDPLARADYMRHYVHHALTRDGDGRYRWRFDAAKLGEFPRSVSEGRLWAAIEGIAQPTLLIRGKHSPLLSLEDAAEVVHRLKDGSLLEIRDGGHDLGVEQPEAVATAVMCFLGEA